MGRPGGKKGEMKVGHFLHLQRVSPSPSHKREQRASPSSDQSTLTCAPDTKWETVSADEKPCTDGSEKYNSQVRRSTQTL